MTKESPKKLNRDRKIGDPSTTVETSENRVTGEVTVKTTVTQHYKDKNGNVYFQKSDLTKSKRKSGLAQAAQHSLMADIADKGASRSSVMSDMNQNKNIKPRRQEKKNKAEGEG